MTRGRLAVRRLVLAFLAAMGALSSMAMAEKASNYLSIVRFQDIPGWQTDGQAAALAAFKLSCREILRHGRAFSRHPQFAGERQDWLPVCKAASALPDILNDRDARAFFEGQFVPVALKDGTETSGLITGYYEPEVPGSRTPGPGFPAPLYRKPPDLVTFNAAQRRKSGMRYGRLVNGTPRAYPTRKQIENGLLAGKGLEIVWLKSWVDALFIQVQGSGRVRLPDGGVVRLAFAAKSGRPYTAVGKVLIDMGAIAREDMSMQAIRAWMAQNPQQTREIIWKNESYIFFREMNLENAELGPPGAQQVQLTPFRSLAVDRRYWSFGTPLWLDTQIPVPGGGGLQPFQHLMVAQDTGSAILGRIRGDLFFGAGEDAAWLAGHMKSPGSLHALLPRPVAKRLELVR